MFYIIIKQNRKIKRQKSKLEIEYTKSKENQIQFISKAILNILGIKSLESVELGKQAFFNSVILEANVSHFDQLNQTLNVNQIFNYINEVLDLTVPYVYEFSGTIDSYKEAGFQAYFFDAYEMAIQCALMICEKIAEERSELLKTFSIGLCNGQVMIGIVGHKERISTLTLSNTTRLATELQRVAGRFYSRILITETLKNKIPQFDKKYNYRWIGTIYFEKEKRVDKVYDLFDGDLPSTRNMKRKTKKMFEKGIQYYQLNEVDEARRCFIEVIKMDKNDLATKEYLYLCDQSRTEFSHVHIAVY